MWLIAVLITWTTQETDMAQKINVTTDTLAHLGETKVEEDVKPVVKVRLNDEMSLADISKMLTEARQKQKGK